MIEQRRVEHYTALHSMIRGRAAYAVGPLARSSLNAEKLHPRAAELLPRVCDAVGRPLPWRSNYLSLLARGLEVVHALALAADLLEHYTLPTRPRIPVTPRAGLGGHGTEAPRGLCWHQYRTEAIPSRTVLWSAGVKASPLGNVLAAAAGIETDRVRFGG